MARLKTARAHRVDRHRRARKKVVGTALRPRLCTFRSSRHIYAQIIDDHSRTTIISASSLGMISEDQEHNKTEVATNVGSLIASKATNAGISTVVFDRGGYPYHGRIQALAESAREGGLIF
jgi:large subunit ribosomal protein L18